MLGYEDAICRTFLGAGDSSFPILMDDVYCDGSEMALDLCSFYGWERHNCDHSEDVAVVCSVGKTITTLLKPHNTLAMLACVCVYLTLLYNVK